MAQPVDHLIHLDVTMVAFDMIASDLSSLMGRLTSNPSGALIISDLCVEISHSICAWVYPQRNCIYHSKCAHVHMVLRNVNYKLC